MSRKGEPRPPPWTPKEVLELRRYAARGFSAREAGKMLGRSHRGVEQLSQRIGLRWHGPMGAPLMNHNRKRGEWRKELRRIVGDDTPLAAD